jgi:hypothetical protein
MPTVELPMKALLEQMYPIDPQPTVPADAVDFHLLSVILLLSTRGDVLNRTLPIGGSPSAAALHELGVQPDRVPQEAIERLQPFREGFAAVQRAWLTLAGYENPPCPPNAVARQIVDATAGLN